MRPVLFAATCICFTTPGFAETFTFHHENVLGTSLELRVEADTAATAESAEATVLSEVDRLNLVLSTYRADSEMSQFLAKPCGMVKISQDLHNVLKACDQWETKSNGAFNARVEAFTSLWKQAAKMGENPSPASINATAERIKSPAWKSADGLLAERLGDAPITVSALAKGYIIQQAGQKAYDPSHGVSGVLLNIGGDLQAWGAAPQTVAIADPNADAENATPLTYTALQQQALATSGSYRRGVDIAGKHRSHIIDPRTGQPADSVLSASVCAPDATTADALATIFSVLTPEESLHLADVTPGVSCLIVTTEGAFRSSNWREVSGPKTWSLVQAPAPAASATTAPEKPAAAPTAPADLIPERAWKSAEGKSMEAAVISVSGDTVKFRLKAGTTTDYSILKLSPEDQKFIRDAQSSAAADWGKHYEMLVNYEINAATGGRYHRPYVAIWIEDKDGNPIRTLSLLMQSGGKGMKYIRDLKRWSRSDQQRRTTDNTDVIPTVSSATRNPGTYSATWDGLDNAKAQVKPGTYTVYIEAAREHGTYQLMKKEVTVGGSTFNEKLDGNEEIKAASLEYRAITATAK